MPREIVIVFPIAWQASISAARNWQLAKSVPGKTPLPAPHIWPKDEGMLWKGMRIRAFDRSSCGNPPVEKYAFTNAIGITSITVSFSDG